MFLKVCIVLSATLAACSPATSTPATPTSFNSWQSFQNRTSTTAYPTNCCFVIQDTVNEAWWPVTTLTYTLGTVNLTSITTLITPYPNGTVTNVVTNVYQTEGNVPVNRTLYDAVFMYPNDAFNLLEENENQTEMDGTAFVTAGITIQSPQAFIVYTTVKIITASPVVATDGYTRCGTVSSWGETNYFGIQATFSNINSNVEAYFDIPSSPSTVSGMSEIEPREVITPLGTAIETSVFDSTGDFAPSITVAGLEITLATPFIYQPTRGASPNTNPCFQGGGTENFGYIPQTLMDYLTQDPYYVSMYPDLPSCFAGGPSILPIMHLCQPPKEIADQTAVGGDLTESTTSTVLLPNGNLYSQSSPIPEINGEGTSSTTTSATAPDRQSPTSISSVLNILVGDSTAGGSSIGSIMLVNGGPAIVIQATTIPAQNAPPGLTGSTTVISGTTMLIIPSPTTIQNLPGSQTIISGSTFQVFSSPTTIPANPNLAIEGSKTVISGTTMVVIPSATSVPVLPGSLTVISGSTYHVFTGPATVSVNAAFSLIGTTTVISGVTEVVLTKATTVAIGKQTPTGNVQASGGVRQRSLVIGFAYRLLCGFRIRFR